LDNIFIQVECFESARIVLSSGVQTENASKSVVLESVFWLIKNQTTGNIWNSVAD